MNKLRIAFFGTNDFSAVFMEKILHDPEIPVEIKLVVTQPDKPVGRKQILTPSPVKVMAQKHALEVYEGKVKELTSKITEYNLDLALLYSFGEIIPASLLKAFRYGFWNVHPSLLPMYRNVAPMVYPLILGDVKTGTTMIMLDEKLDHGPIISQIPYEIKVEDTRQNLEITLAEVAYSMFRESVLEVAKNGQIPPLEEQLHEKATYTRRLKKDDGFLPFLVIKKGLVNEPLEAEKFPQILREYWEKYPGAARFDEKNYPSALFLYNFFKGMHSWPGVWTIVNINGAEKRLKITGMKFEDNKVFITKLQLEGKSEVDFATFERAYQIF
jgi:methionyl-tRNA formyltransferase